MQGFTHFKLQQSYEPANCYTGTIVAFCFNLSGEEDQQIGKWADINLQISLGPLISEPVNEFHSRGGSM